MNYANAKAEFEIAQVQSTDTEVSALTTEQLEMIAGGECVLNQF